MNEQIATIEQPGLIIIFVVLLDRDNCIASLNYRNQVRFTRRAGGIFILVTSLLAAAVSITIIKRFPHDTFFQRSCAAPRSVHFRIGAKAAHRPASAGWFHIHHRSRHRMRGYYSRIACERRLTRNIFSGARAGLPLPR